jgi:hypothetical protein
MINYLKNLLHKLFYKGPIIVPINPEDILGAIDDKYICEINFKLTPSQEIDIEFVHSDVQTSSVEKIAELAENYANLIVLINAGFLKKQLIDTIKYHKKQNMNNDKNTLLLDNVLFFNNLLQEELKTIKKEHGPLVKPSSVFKSLN